MQNQDQSGKYPKWFATKKRWRVLNLLFFAGREFSTWTYSLLLHKIWVLTEFQRRTTIYDYRISRI